LFIDNLYIKNNNIGNVESYLTLYNPELILDNDGNCYTLNNNDFNFDYQYFIFNPSSFFKSPYQSHENYHFGYIHMFWNYTDDSSYVETFNTNKYQPNYIRGTFTEDTGKDISIVKTDSYGNFIRDWNSSYFTGTNNILIREQLINLLDYQTINDIELPDTISNEDKEYYKDYHGIIKTEKQKIFRTYDLIKTLDGHILKTYKNVDGKDEIINIEPTYNYETKNYYALVINKDNKKSNCITSCKMILTPNQSIELDAALYNYNNSVVNSNIITRNVYKDKIFFKISSNDLIKEGTILFGNSKQLPSAFNIENINEYFRLPSEDGMNYHKLILTVTDYCELDVECSINTEDMPMFDNDTINWYLTSTNINKLIDFNFNSSIIYVNDPKEFKINLALNDIFAKQYRHHDILQWIQTPNGFKYYSKHTYAHYNYQYNTYDIVTDWDNTNITIPGFIDTSTIGSNSLFDIIIKDNEMEATSLIINTSTNNDQEYVKYVEIYLNSSLILDKTNVLDTNGIITLNDVIPVIVTENQLNNENILNELYLKTSKTESDKNNILITIKYAVIGEEECTHITTYEYNLNHYNEYRTLPIVNLHLYNNMESLEQLNKIENGVLCNQFQYFIDIKIDDFNSNNWGKLINEYKDINIELTLKLEETIKTLNDEDLSSILKISYSLIEPDVDIINI